MIFNSLSYFIFLLLLAIIFYITPGRFRWLPLLAGSILYYISFIPVYLSLFAGIIFINFYLAFWISKSPADTSNRRMIIVLFLNLFILGFFKYFTFIFPDVRISIYNFDLLYKTDKISSLVLPLGLSYFIFTILSYQIEIKRKNILPEKHFGYFSLYLMFFPKIAQGPIERPQKLLAQLHQSGDFSYEMVTGGLKLMLWGYFKKMVVADNLALYVNSVYNFSDRHNGTSLALATFFFAFQIYADFSGYTDIALGSAKIFGIDLTDNFRRPYFATSIKDFWTRWHISFSTWIRDYIFLPLAYYFTNRLSRPSYLFISKEKWIYMFAAVITFMICGIWHGVGWTYLIWGVLFGIYLTWSNWLSDSNKKLRKNLKIKKTSKLFIFYGVASTFLLVLFAWIFFRANSLESALDIIRKIFTEQGKLYIASPANMLLSVFAVLSMITLDIRREYLNERYSLLNNKYLIVRLTGIVLIVLTIMLIGIFDGGQFIYFQF
jgi:alginate O-acetyltransferase complex protein AlgI